MRVLVATFVLATLSAILAGCSGTEDDVANFLTDQTKFEFYSCPQIAQSLDATTKRVHELERVMATASRGNGGQAVNAVAYRPEYLQQRGNMNALLRTAREKHCDPGPTASKTGNQR